MKRILLCSFGFVLFFLNTPAQSIRVDPYVAGLSNPIDVKHCGDERLFIAERLGRIRVVNPDGSLRPTPFIDFIPKVSGLAGEEGFLGFCFSPNGVKH